MIYKEFYDIEELILYGLEECRSMGFYGVIKTIFTCKRI